MFEKTHEAVAARQPRPRRRRHPLAWTAVTVNLGFATWLLVALGPYTGPAPSDSQAVGDALAAAGIGLLWLVADFVLLIVWAARRARR